MRIVSDKGCRENQNTHFMLNNIFFFENRAVYEIMWENTVDLGKPQMTIWRMRITCWIPNATKALSEYVTLIASPLQKRLHGRTSLLRSTCIILVFKSPVTISQFLRDSTMRLRLKSSSPNQ